RGALNLNYSSLLLGWGHDGHRAAASERAASDRTPARRARRRRTPPHATAETVLDAVRRELPGLSVQGVYDVLRALSDAGIVRRIEPAGHPARFERRTGDNHHHV